jgi:hypothetical protein
LLGQLDCAIDLLWFEEGRPVEDIATASQEMRDQEHDRARLRKDTLARAFRKVQDRGQIDITGRQIYLLEAPPDRDKGALVAGSRDYHRDRFDKDPEFIKSLTDLGSRDYEEWIEARTRYLEVRNRLRSRYKKWRDPATNGERIIIDVIPTNNEEHRESRAVQRDKDKEASAPPPPGLSPQFLPEHPLKEPEAPEVSGPASTLVHILATAHREVVPPGSIPRTEALVAAILSQSLDPEVKFTEILNSHRAFLPWWKEQRSRNANAFIPQLWRWFQDGDYLHPPGQEAMKAASATANGKTKTKPSWIDEYRAEYSGGGQ